MSDKLFIAKIYAPVLVVVTMSVLQILIVMAQIGLERKKKRKNLPTQMSYEDWHGNTVWDDVICTVACSTMMCGMCHFGATDWAWITLTPVMVLGLVTTTYHFVQMGVDAAPNL